MNKQKQYEEYTLIIKKYTDKKLLNELKSYRKYFESHSQYFDWTYLNPEDFSNNDKFNIIRNEVKERGLKEC